MWKAISVLVFLCVSTLYGQSNPEPVMGMRIESATETGGRIEVVTTGAKFEFDGEGSVQCWQRLPRLRRVLQISFAQAAVLS